MQLSGPICPAASGAEAAFPRIGMLWSAADGPESRLEKWARYGLIVTSPDALGFRWEKHEFAGLAEGFRPESLAAGREFLAALRERNPRTVVLCELYYFEARTNAYPPDSPWWFRDRQGNKVQFWQGCHNISRKERGG